MQQCTGYRPVSVGSQWLKLLLPYFTAVVGVLGTVAPQLASRLLAPCELQEAQYVFLKVNAAQPQNVAVVPSTGDNKAHGGSQQNCNSRLASVCYVSL